MTDRTSTTLTGKEMKKRAGAMKGINETDPNDMAFKGAMIFGGVGAMMMMPTTNDASASIASFATAVNSGDNDDDLRGLAGNVADML